MLNKFYNGETLTSYSLKTIRNWTIWTPPFDSEWPKTYIVICGLYSSLPEEKDKYFRTKNVYSSMQGFRTYTMVLIIFQILNGSKSFIEKNIMKLNNYIFAK